MYIGFNQVKKEERWNFADLVDWRRERKRVTN
jgi:hypothetical protein